MARVLTALIAACLVVAGLLVVAPAAEAAPAKGNLAVTVQGPKGVPVKAVASKGKSKFTVSKSASAKSKKATRKVVTGKWSVKASPVLYKGKYYKATVKPSSVMVSKGKTVSVKVAYARSKAGQLVVTVKAPKGVPVTAVVSKGASKFAVAKSAAAKSKRVTKDAKVGYWSVKAPAAQYKGKYYTAKVKTSKKAVHEGKKTYVTVTYTRAQTATGLRVSGIKTTRLGMKFTKPKKSTQVALRYSTGTKAPKSVKSGKGVKLGKTASSVTITGLKPGNTYSVSLFTKVGKKWVGPVSVSAGTTAQKSKTKPTASFTAAPDTVLVQVSDKVPAKATASGASATLPTSQTPVIGQPMVLPNTSKLPGGFVGKVKTISTDGRTVTLEQAALTEVFGTLDVSVPDLSKVGTEKQIAAPKSAAPASVVSGGGGLFAAGAVNAKAAAKVCEGSGSKAITMPTPEFESGGHLNLKTRNKRGAFGLNTPIGMDLDIEAKFTGTMKVGAKVDGSYKCSKNLVTVERTFMAGPVPLLLKFDASAQIEAKGSIDVTGVGVTATTGFAGKAYVPLPGGGKYSSSAQPINKVKWLSPSIAAEGSLGAKIGGDLSFGPGASATGIAGAQTGITGSLYPFTADATITAGTGLPWCLAVDSGGETSAKIFAKAWVGKWTAEASHEFFNKSWKYGVFKFPKGCEPKLPATKFVKVDPWKDGTAAKTQARYEEPGDWCWGSSLSDRKDAARCNLGNYLMDPCFLKSMGTYYDVYCHSSTKRIRVTHVPVEENTGGSPGGGLPIELKLADGSSCVALSGAGPQGAPGFPGWRGVCSGKTEGIWRAEGANEGKGRQYALYPKAGSPGVWQVAVSVGDETSKPVMVAVSEVRY